MLQDLDRPIIEYQYGPWQRVVKFRRLSAGQFVQVMAAITAAGDDDSAAKIAAMAQVCEIGIVDPKATAEEWREVTLATLTHLGTRVLETHADSIEEAKKN